MFEDKARYLFIEPRGSFDLRTPENLVGLAAYLFTCSLIIGFGEALRSSHRLAKEQREVLHVTQGSLYPALQRMKTKGLIRSAWRTTENNRQARYYMLTAAGQRQLERELSQWQRSSMAINWVLGWNGGSA